MRQILTFIKILNAGTNLKNGEIHLSPSLSYCVSQILLIIIFLHISRFG
jgi:hypothetical protein